MIFCRDCNIPMLPVMSFTKDKNEKFNRCPKCYGETRHQKLLDSELDFGQVLHKEMNKRK